MTTSFLASLALELKSVFDPLASALGSTEGLRRFVRRFGWTVDTFSMAPGVETADTSDDAPNNEDPDEPFDEEGVIGAVTEALDLAPLFASLKSAAETLSTSTDEGDAASALLAVAGNLTKSLGELALLAASPPQLPFPLDQEDLWREVPPLLLDELIAEYLEDRWTPVYGTFVLLGVIELSTVTPTGKTRTPYVARHIHWPRMAELISG